MMVNELEYESVLVVIVVAVRAVGWCPSTIFAVSFILHPGYEIQVCRRRQVWKLDSLIP